MGSQQPIHRRAQFCIRSTGFAEIWGPFCFWNFRGREKDLGVTGRPLEGNHLFSSNLQRGVLKRGASGG
jgi:hypothetical protein